MNDMQPLTDDLAARIATKLVELQGSRTDAEMGALLGCTREHYCNIKNGKRRVSYALTKQAASVFLELGFIVIRDITEPVKASA